MYSDSSKVKKIKVIWLLPISVDILLQNTSRSEAARALGAHGIQVDAIAGYYNELKDIPGFSKVHYVRIHRKGLLRKCWSVLLLFTKICRTESDVVIFSLGLVCFMPLLRLYCFLTSQKRILILDVRSILVPEERYTARSLINKFVLSLMIANFCAHAVTTITDELKKYISRYLPSKKQNMLVWESGVNCKLFDPEKINPSKIRGKIAHEEDFVLIYHGQIEKSRGLQELIKACSILDKQLKVKLLLVGDGKDRADLEAFTRESGIGSRIVFTGKVPYSEVPAYISSADLAVIPLPNDDCWNVSSPLKLFEYLAMGTPIIATSIEAHTSVLKELGGGILIVNHFAKTIADSVEGFITGQIQIPKPRHDVREIINWETRTLPLANYLLQLCK